MDIAIIVALIGISGVGASALIQYYLGRQSEKNKKAVEIRSQAYLDLINAVSEIASSARHNEPRDLEQLQNLNKAKARVILVGSNNVVKEVHHFFTEYGVLNSDTSFDAFSDIVAEMRSDLSGERSLDDKILVESLFGQSKE